MITIASRARDPRAGLTLNQLAAFIQDALRQDVPGDAPVTVTIGWRGQIRTITTATTDEEQTRQP